MDTQLTTMHGTWRLLVAAVALALVTALGATSASASSTSCRVQNTDSGKTYAALQQAVDAASKGERLAVRGTCIGTTVIGTKLVIEGVRTPTTGKPKLSGGGKVGVLRVKKAVRVRMRSIEIVRGSGGIYNEGRLTLVDVTVRDNEEGFDAGVLVLNYGTLKLEGSSRISHNFVSVASFSLAFRGGVLNRGTLVMSDQSVISGNLGYGAAVDNKRTLTMNDASSIHDNRARTVYEVPLGAGVFNKGTLTMNDASSIHGNRGGIGAGVYNVGTLTMNDASSIHGNRSGGGVSNEGTLTMNGTSSIHDNWAWPGGGGGVSNSGTLTMNGTSSIHHNTASEGGGVVSASWDSEFAPATVAMSDSSSIHDNRAVRNGGGGLVSMDSTLIGVVCAAHESPNVYGNTPDDCLIQAR